MEERIFFIGGIVWIGADSLTVFDVVALVWTILIVKGV